MGSMPISSELLGFAQFPQFALASRMPDVIPSAARVIVGTDGSAGNSDELRQLPSVLIRPAKAEIFQASIDLAGNSDSFAGHFRRRGLGQASPSSTPRTTALPNRRAVRLWWDRMNEA